MNKLQKVKEALEAIYIINTRLDNTKEETTRLINVALAELNEFMDRLESEELVETLAELEHEQWMVWSKHIANAESISPERLANWKDNYWRPYSELSDSAQEMDRTWARKAQAAINVIKEEV